MSINTSQVLSLICEIRSALTNVRLAVDKLEAACCRPVNKTCSICQDVSQDGNVATSCSHAFHMACLQSWFSYSTPPVCPVCRKTITSVSFC